MTIQYFPQGVVTDGAFCNRVEERRSLKERIDAHEHTVLIAPRRYGKTSLIAQVLADNSYLGVSADFFSVLTREEVAQHVFNHVSDMMVQLMPKEKGVAQKLLDAVCALNSRISLSFFGQKLEISVSQHHDRNISDALLALDCLAQKVQKSCVFILDEFQQIGELKESHAIEAEIRHAVERSKNVIPKI